MTLTDALSVLGDSSLLHSTMMFEERMFPSFRQTY